MLQEFKNHLALNFPFLEHKKLLLAVSGGIDSMVVTHLFQQLNFQIAIAHCNFQLRGIASFEDQNFVSGYSNSHKIPFFSNQFDTKAFADDYKLSTQVAARELRYNWFYELIELEQYDFIITAHHADDNLETFLINLSRGTGLDGLTGIPTQNDQLIRPLMPFSRQEIEAYAAVNMLQWREDSSNATDVYLRNNIRHHLVPILKELNPNFLSSFQKTQNYLQESQTMVADATALIYQQVAKESGDAIYFDLQQLLKFPNYKSYLYQWLREFGFHAWQDIYNLVKSQSGKHVFSAEFRLLKDRNFLHLTAIKNTNSDAEFLIYENKIDVNLPINLSFEIVDGISVVTKSAIFVDKQKLVYPLLLRNWHEGDVFLPFGMNGKSKKVSKLFKDEKIAQIDKEKIWILCSENKIVWVIGIRQDERFKIEDTTQLQLKITILK